MPEENEIQTVAALVGNAEPIRQPSLAPGVVFAQENWSLHNVEEHLQAPTRKKGCAKFYGVQSFIDYVNEQKSDNSRIYAPTNMQFIAVFNHHAQAPELPGWGDFRAELNLKPTPDWLAWNGSNGKGMTQRQFADFIELNADAITEPVGAEVLDMVRFFQATSTVEFKSAEQEKSGNIHLEYVQTSSTKAGQKGTAELPREITVYLQPYEGGPSAFIVARLSYAIDGGQLRLCYQLVNVAQYLDRLGKDIAATIEKSTKTKLFYGQPS